MDEHRIKPMPQDYDQELFMDIFKKTEKLRHKLAYEIDSRRFGVTTEDVKCWFANKFLHAFNKYYGKKEPEVLKAYIINSLSFFKIHIIKKAYSKQALSLLEQVNIEEAYGIGELPEELLDLERQEKVNKVKTFFKGRLSKQTYDIFLATIYPPEYIIERNISDPKKIHRVSNESLAEFFDLPLKEIEKSRREIRNATKRARINLR